MINNKSHIILYCLLLFFILCLFYAYNIRNKIIKTHIGDEFFVKVVKLSDIDSIYVINKNNQKLKIRLANIYFPRKNMLGHYDSLEMIGKELIGNEVKIKIIDKDKYNRFLAVVFLNDKDFNYYLVENGCAWHFKRYARSHQSRLDYINYHKAEKLAKENKKCLWNYQLYNYSKDNKKIKSNN